eukprot:tig00020553_g10715.t1
MRPRAVPVSPSGLDVTAVKDATNPSRAGDVDWNQPDDGGCWGGVEKYTVNVKATEYTLPERNSGDLANTTFHYDAPDLSPFVKYRATVKAHTRCGSKETEDFADFKTDPENPRWVTTPAITSVAWVDDSEREGETVLYDEASVTWRVAVD